jgi:RNA polymerase sigma-70 factor (ECF subfamily)
MNEKLFIITQGDESMEDTQIIALYWNRDEHAISETAEKYGRYCHSVAYGILQNNEDSEECVNDTYTGAWNSIPPHKPENFPAYVCRIGRNVSLKRCRRNTAAKRNTVYEVALEELENSLSGLTLEEIWSARELGRAIDRFLDTLDRQTRVIFVRRYWFADSVKEIAVLMGMSENNISVRLSRTRSRLRRYLEKEGVEL